MCQGDYYILWIRCVASVKLSNDFADIIIPTALHRPDILFLAYHNHLDAAGIGHAQYGQGTGPILMDEG